MARAREAAAHARAVLSAGRDPLAAKRARLVSPTFGEFADDLLETLAPQWRNEKHRYQWRMTLQKYAAPLRPIALDKIGTDDVLRVLKPLWTSRPETASRLRGRIERVLEAATVRGHRSGPNPALWRGSLRALLPKPKKQIASVVVSRFLDASTTLRRSKLIVPPSPAWALTARYTIETSMSTEPPRAMRLSLRINRRSTDAKTKRPIVPSTAQVVCLAK